MDPGVVCGVCEGVGMSGDSLELDVGECRPDDGVAGCRYRGRWLGVTLPTEELSVG